MKYLREMLFFRRSQKRFRSVFEIDLNRNSYFEEIA
jgi:hypothetical protein